MSFFPKNSIRHFFRKILDSIVSKYEHKIIPKRYTARNMYDFLNFIKENNFYPNTIYDVGTAYGTFSLYDVFKNSKFILIEPLIEYEEYLKAICNKYDAEYHITALGDEYKTSSISVYPNNLLASSLINRKTLNFRLKHSKSREISIQTLDSFIDYKPPYLIKIDAEGYELNVLKGAKSKLQNTELIILETNSVFKYQNNHTFRELIDFLDNNNFVFFDILDIRDFGFPIPYCNMAFINKTGDLFSYLSDITEV